VQRLSSVKSFFTRIRLTTYLALAVVTIVTYFILTYTIDDFWQSYLSNALATMVGILIGVPVTIWIASIQEQETEIERRNRILGLLRRELLVNFGQLAGWGRHEDKRIEVSTLSEFLRDELWVAASSADELKWIKDSNLLSELANAYSSIRMVKSMADKYYNLSQFFGKQTSPRVVHHVWDMLENGVPLALEDISHVLKSIKLPGDKEEEK